MNTEFVFLTNFDCVECTLARENSNNFWFSSRLIVPLSPDMRHIDFDGLWKDHLFDYKDGDLLVIDDITRLNLSDYVNTTLEVCQGAFGHVTNRISAAEPE